MRERREIPTREMPRREKMLSCSSGENYFGLYARNILKYYILLKAVGVMQ